MYVLLMLYVLHEMQLANSGVGYLLGTSPVVGVKPITVVASLVLWRCRQRSVVILDVSANVDGSVWGTVACSPRQAHQPQPDHQRGYQLRQVRLFEEARVTALS